MARAELVLGDTLSRRLRRPHATTAAAVALLAMLGAGCGQAAAPSSQPSEPDASIQTTVVTRAPVSTDSVPAVADETTPTTTSAVILLSSSTEPASTTAAPAEDGPLTLDVLSFIVVGNEHDAGYVRDLFGYPADLDGDSCDTRSEVLQRDSTTLAAVDPFGCTVVAGDWLSLYDGMAFTSPGELEIDHVVALKEAWDSGAWAWTGAARLAFANDVSDLRTLRAVSTTTNRSKGDRDPSNWLPPDSNDVCSFISDWVAIKSRWGLSMDSSEHGRIGNLLANECQGSHVAPSAPTGVSVEPPPPPPTTPSTVAPVTPSSSDVYYANCTAARAAGAAPLHTGDPGYRSGLDRDHDGIACE